LKVLRPAAPTTRNRQSNKHAFAGHNSALKSIST
jgi:hypothetical protein